MAARQVSDFKEFGEWGGRLTGWEDFFTEIWGIQANCPQGSNFGVRHSWRFEQEIESRGLLEMDRKIFQTP